MKKYISILLALVMILSIFAIPAYAAEADATPYTPTCPSCKARLRTTGRNYIEHYSVPGCAEDDDYHVHYDRYYERTWYCGTASCEMVGYVVDRETTLLESNICHIVRPIE